MAERTKAFGPLLQDHLWAQEVTAPGASSQGYQGHTLLLVWARGDHFLEGQGGGEQTRAAFWSSANWDKGDPHQGAEGTVANPHSRLHQISAV